MAKIRAYKIAEELGLDPDELLQKAREAGIELKSKMVALEDEEAAELRRRLAVPAGKAMVEKRVGSGIIRRRRREEPAAPPEPPPLAEAAPAVSEEPAVAEPVAAGAQEIEAPAEAPAPVEEPAPLAAEASPAFVEPAAPVARPTGGVPGGVAPVESTERGDRGEPAGPRGVRVRREVIQTVNLREQETLARLMRDKAQRRLEQRRQIVEQQSRALPRHRRSAAAAPPRGVVGRREQRPVLRVTGPVPLAELSRQAGVKLTELLRRARNLDIELDREAPVAIETIELLAADLGLEFQLVRHDPEDKLAAEETPAEDLQPRPPVVTVMGHVDHGKTSLLDRIRKANVVEGEAGGITQHIGAYKVRTDDGREIAFLDTPGHAAFTQMRARGAQVTDIAVLVVAADDGIMPQTIEAISHARAAGVPIVVAINKVDKPDANVARTRQGLLEQGLVPEELGGDTICVEVSAKQGTNVDRLLEMLAVQAEVLELRARRKGPARGTVIEAQLDRGRGAVATVLVREGTLRRGDAIVVGTAYGRLRALLDERGAQLKEATPSTPVQVVGLSAVPDAGDEFVVAKNEREAKEIADHRVAELRRAAGGEAAAPLEAEALFAQLDESEEKHLAVVLKADVRGTAEAIKQALEDLSGERVTLRVIHSGVGAITESDVMLAAASRALVVGFHVRPDPAARKLAERQGVDLRTHDIVYEVIDDVKQAMAGLLPPKRIEKVEAYAEVLKRFQIPRVGAVAGSIVRDGTFKRSNPVRLVRDGVPIYSGRLASLRRFKDDVREVASGMECGISIENYTDVKVGDRIESYSVEERPETL